MFTRIDLWVGKTLFVPPIIKFCQITRQSQHAVSRLFWFAAMLSGLYWATSAVDYLIFGLGSFAMMFTASLRADHPTRSALWFRMFALVSLVLRIAMIFGGEAYDGIEFWFFVLIAEYASTIRTIPPRETEQASRQAAGYEPR
ncbi:hypothetical protein SAMN06295912_11735 [Sphingomonas laterariae]|uniref:Uncharacterized protein n=2 Tax=Edaphosphingomonas laterariae TaxID=861865 RepID=A0A239HJH0_9SPHN|nr:hypothetical protein SAMN06295912_11735 [Sphingomonas laterariae]